MSKWIRRGILTGLCVLMLTELTLNTSTTKEDKSSKNNIVATENRSENLAMVNSKEAVKEEISTEDTENINATYSKVEELEGVNNGEVPTVYVDEDNTCKYIDGSFTDMKVQSEEEAIKSVDSVKELMNIENPEVNLSVDETNKSDKLVSYKLQQKYNGVDVYGRQVIVATDKEGNTTSIGGNYLDDINIDTTPTISEDEVKTKLKEKYGEKSAVTVKGLTIYTINNVEPVLCWNTEVKNEEEGELTYLKVFVNASNGEIVAKESLIQVGNVETKVTDLNDKERTINVYELSKKEKYNIFRKNYELNDTVRNIKVYSALDLKLFSLLPGTIVGTKDNVWTDKAAVSAMANLEETYDYYYNKFGRVSYDDNGATIVASVHYKAPFTNVGYDNAFWTSLSSQFVFGDGYEYFTPLSGALDVVAHEYTHAVIENTAGLIYYGESGALNESYADIMGNLIEGKDDPEWLIGEDIMKIDDAGLRSMSNPEQFMQPSKVGGEYYADTEDEYDNGGVHINSGILNHAAYLMWKNGITDKEQLAELFYTSLFLMTESADFTDCRIAVVSAAKKLEMSDKELEIINNAFDEVGISDLKIEG